MFHSVPAAEIWRGYLQRRDFWTLRTVVDRHLQKPYLREKSQDAVKYALNHQIPPVLGGYRLRDISPMQIQALMAGLAGKSNSLQSKVQKN